MGVCPPAPPFRHHFAWTFLAYPCRWAAGFFESAGGCFCGVAFLSQGEPGKHNAAQKRKTEYGDHFQAIVNLGQHVPSLLFSVTAWFRAEPRLISSRSLTLGNSRDNGWVGLRNLVPGL